jgi:hypothetical protein
MAAAELVKDAMKRDITIREVAAERIEVGKLKHKDEGRLITITEVDKTLGNLENLTKGGIS